MMHCGDLRLDTVAREAFRGDIRLRLGRRELGLLEELMQRPDRLAPREVLLDSLYDQSEEVMPNALDAAVSRLRRALRDAGARETIQTVRGIGWLLSTAEP
jgi:DNA-binding response OmpR family regulator